MSIGPTSTNDPIVCVRIGRSTWQGPASEAPQLTNNPVTVKCPDCDGTGGKVGSVPPFRPSHCYGCNGTGSVPSTKERDELQAAIARLTAERDQALKVSEHRQRNSAETWEAMQTMRNAINEHIPMPSMESDLLQGPENSVFCAAVAEAVITGIQSRAAAAAMEMRERAVKWHEEVIKHDQGGIDYSDAVGIPISNRYELEQSVKAYSYSAREIRALPIDPDAKKALDRLLAKAWDEGRKIGRHWNEAAYNNPYRTPLTDGGRDGGV